MTQQNDNTSEIEQPEPAGPEPGRFGQEENAAVGATETSEDDHDAFDLIELVRQRLNLDVAIPDVTIAASLMAVSAKSDRRERWLAAFSSPLGKCLAMQGVDLNTALNTVMALAPKPTN